MPRKILCLATLLSLSIAAASCAPVLPSQKFPPAEDLLPATKPVVSIDVLTSEVASEKHNADIEAWGDGLYLQLGRLCRWEQGLGAPVTCPAPPPAVPVGQ